MCHPNGGILSGGSSLLSPQPCLRRPVRRRWPSARGPAGWGAGRGVARRPGSRRGRGGARRPRRRRLPRPRPRSGLFFSAFSSWDGRRTSVAIGGGPSPPRASSRPIPRSGRRCRCKRAAPGTARAWHMASEVPTARVAMQASSCCSRGYQPRANRWISPAPPARRRRRRRHLRVGVLERAGTPRASGATRSLVQQPPVCSRALTRGRFEVERRLGGALERRGDEDDGDAREAAAIASGDGARARGIKRGMVECGGGVGRYGLLHQAVVAFPRRWSRGGREPQLCPAVSSCVQLCAPRSEGFSSVRVRRGFALEGSSQPRAR